MNILRHARAALAAALILFQPAAPSLALQQDVTPVSRSPSISLPALPASPTLALLQLQGAGVGSSSAACVLWTPANLATAPRYIFDPDTFTYSGSNFSSGTNSGSVGGSYTAESGTVAKGTALNGHTTLNFTGTQGLLNTGAVWPASTDIFVFAVANVGTTQGNGLASHSWATSERTSSTSSWVFYPRGGSAFGGGANEGWLFNGNTAAIITRGTLFSDTSYHVVYGKTGSQALMAVDGTTITPTATTGTIGGPTTSSNFRIGATGPSAAEPLTGLVAYVAALSNPTTLEAQKYIGWAAWRFGLQANLPGGFPYAAAPPCQ